MTYCAFAKFLMPARIEDGHLVEGDEVEASGLWCTTITEAVRQFIETYNEVPTEVRNRHGRRVWKGRQSLVTDGVPRRQR